MNRKTPLLLGKRVVSPLQQSVGLLTNMMISVAADEQPWVFMIQEIRSCWADVFISGAPQCPLSEEWFQMHDIIGNASFDALFIQFYNNPGCQATDTGFNFDDWVTYIGTTEQSQHAQLFIGLPGSEASAWQGYIGPNDAQDLICKYKSHASFGGVSIWEAKAAFENTACGKNFVDYCSDALALDGCGPHTCFPTSTSSTSTSTTSTSTSTSSTSTTTTTTSTTSTTTSTTSTTSSTHLEHDFLDHLEHHIRL